MLNADFQRDHNEMRTTAEIHLTYWMKKKHEVIKTCGINYYGIVHYRVRLEIVHRLKCSLACMADPGLISAYIYLLEKCHK